MFELILIAIGLVLLYLLVVYIIAPLSGILFFAAMVGGAGYALYVSLHSFIRSLIMHKNPYNTYVDKSKHAPAGVRRGYFFGPGFHQIAKTVSFAFEGLKWRISSLKQWRNRVVNRLEKWYFAIWVKIFYAMAFFSTFVLGFLWMSAFSALLFTATLVGMCSFFLFFSVLWCADRLQLAAKSISSRCTHCKRVSLVPVFICPSCGEQHKRLTPGPYGVLAIKCACGEKLPTTFVNGRSKLTSVCPYCAVELATSEARQFGIQLIGNTSAGKTTFLAAFWHLYLERVKSLTDISVKAYPADAFDTLEEWFLRGLSAATTDLNAIMYSLVHSAEGETPCQLTVYDIAGEAFSHLDSDMQQQQLKYCEGLVFVIDPTAAPSSAEEAITGFLGEFSKLRGRHATKMVDIPVAVIISKADLFRPEIGLSRIKARFKASPLEFADTPEAPSIEIARDAVCREFLELHGYGNARNLILSEFTNVRFFPVSAMGHAGEEQAEYEPFGILEPVVWIIGHAAAPLKFAADRLREVAV